MKRKQLWLALALGLVLVLLCAGSALAATDSLKFEMELNSEKFTEPKTITVSFTVTNVSDRETPGLVTLCYPNGDKVEEFGEAVLAPGSSKNWSGPWSVTQKELEAGKITFIVRYSDYDENGDLKQYATGVRKHIQYAGAAPEIAVDRSIVPQTAQEGQEVSIIYEITNKGSSDVTGVTIVENKDISKESAPVGAIKAGETAKYTFTVKMGKKDLTSAATVKYKAGGKNYTSKVDASVIKYGKVNLSASLSADKKGGAPGDIVKLTLKLKNSGTTDFTDVLVTDEKLGIVFSGQTVKAGETVTLEKELKITETQELLFKVKGNDGAGGETETATGTVKVIATDPAQQIALRVEAVADREAVYQIPGGIVRFTVTVYNDSAVDVENITVKAVDTVLYTFDKIPAGESRYFTRDTEISMQGTFQFTANVKDQLGQVVPFASNEIRIIQTNPPADPTPTPIVMPTKPPEVTVPPQLLAIDDVGKVIDRDKLEEALGEDADPEMKERVGNIVSAFRSHEDETQLEQIEEIAGTAKWILAGIAAVLLLLLLIGAARRIKRRSESGKAIDHLESSVYRDYSVAPRGKRRNEVTSGDDEKAGAGGSQDAEGAGQGSELMAETLQRLYTKKAPDSDAETAAPAQDANAEGGETAQGPEGQPEAPAKPAQPIQSASEAAHRRRAQK